MEHRGREQKGLLVFLRSKGILKNLKFPPREDLGFGAIILYNCYTWPLMQRILEWELVLTNKVDKPKEYMGKKTEEEGERDSSKVSTDELACLMGCEIAVSLSSRCAMIISANLLSCVLTSSQPLPLV